MKANDVDKMKADAVRQYLKKLLTRLDEIEKDDFFGTEGWRHFVMGEDD